MARRRLEAERVYTSAEEAREAGFNVSDEQFDLYKKDEFVQKQAREALTYQARYQVGDYDFEEYTENPVTAQETNQIDLARRWDPEQNGGHDYAAYLETLSGQSDKKSADLEKLTRSAVPLLLAAREGLFKEHSGNVEQTVLSMLNQHGKNAMPYLQSIDPKLASELEETVMQGHGLKDKLVRGTGGLLKDTIDNSLVGKAMWAMEKPQELMMEHVVANLAGTEGELDRDEDGNISLSEALGKVAPKGRDIEAPEDGEEGEGKSLLNMSLDEFTGTLADGLTQTLGGETSREQLERGTFRLADGVAEVVMDPLNALTLGSGQGAKVALKTAQQGADAIGLSADMARISQKITRTGMKSLTDVEMATLRQSLREGGKRTAMGGADEMVQGAEQVLAAQGRTGPGILGHTVLPTGRLGDVGRKVGLLADTTFDTVDGATTITGRQRGLKGMASDNPITRWRGGEAFIGRWNTLTQFDKRVADSVSSSISRNREVIDFQNSAMRLTNNWAGNGVRARGLAEFEEAIGIRAGVFQTGPVGRTLDAAGVPTAPLSVDQEIARDRAIMDAVNGTFTGELGPNAQALVDAIRGTQDATVRMAKSEGYVDTSMGLLPGARTPEQTELMDQLVREKDEATAKLSDLVERGVTGRDKDRLERLIAKMDEEVVELRNGKHEVLNMPITRNPDADYTAVVDRMAVNTDTKAELAQLLQDYPTTRVAIEEPLLVAANDGKPIRNAFEMNRALRSLGADEDLFLTNAADVALAESAFIATRVTDHRILNELAKLELDDGMLAVYGVSGENARAGVLPAKEQAKAQLDLALGESTASRTPTIGDDGVATVAKPDFDKESWIDVKLPDGGVYYIQKDIYDDLENIRMIVRGDPAKTNPVLQGLEEMNQMWAGFATSAGINPAFQMRNLQGNIIFGVLSGLRNPRYLAMSADIQSKLQKARNLSRNSGRDFNEVAEEILGAEQWRIVHEAQRTGAMDTNFAGDVLTRSTPTQNKGKVRRGIDKAVGPDSALSQPGRALASSLENNMRLAVYLDQVDKGATFEAAADHVKKYLIDYGDLTRFERETVRKLSRFYTFMRHNSRIWADALMNQPVTVKHIYDVEAGAEEMIIRGEDDAENRSNLLGDWLQTGSWNSATGQYADVENPMYGAVDMWMTPVALVDAFTETSPLGSSAFDQFVLRAVQSLDAMTGSSSTEVTKALFETMTGVDSFTGRQIERSIADSDLEKLEKSNLYAFASAVAPILGRTLGDLEDAGLVGDGEEKQMAAQLLNNVAGIRSGMYDLEEMEGWERKRMLSEMEEMRSQLNDFLGDESIPAIDDLINEGVIAPKNRVLSVLVGGVKGVAEDGTIEWRSEEDRERFIQIFDKDVREDLGLPVDLGDGAKTEQSNLPQGWEDVDKKEWKVEEMIQAYEFLVGDGEATDELREYLIRETVKTNASKSGNTDPGEPLTLARNTSEVQERFREEAVIWGWTDKQIAEFSPYFSNAERALRNAAKEGITSEELQRWTAGQVSPERTREINEIVNGNPGYGLFNIDLSDTDEQMDTRQYSNLVEKMQKRGAILDLILNMPDLTLPVEEQYRLLVEGLTGADPDRLTDAVVAERGPGVLAPEDETEEEGEDLPGPVLGGLLDQEG
mgnify:CR=1 FL=1